MVLRTVARATLLFFDKGLKTRRSNPKVLVGDGEVMGQWELSGGHRIHTSGSRTDLSIPVRKLLAREQFWETFLCQD